MDCIITAGGRPDPDDSLYAYTQGRPKAYLDMNGRTMLERVVDALQKSKYIEEIVVIGLGSDKGLQFKRPVHHLPDQGGLVNNAVAGIDWLIENRPPNESFVACSADIPLLSAPILDEYLDACQPFDHSVYYIMVTKETMERRFPESNRTYVKLKGAEIAGGDLVVMQFGIVHKNRELFDMLTNARKHAWKIANVVGLRILLKLLTRRLSIADIEETAHRIVGRPAKIVISPHAELAMDADKPHQVDLLRMELRRLQG